MVWFIEVRRVSNFRLVSRWLAIYCLSIIMADIAVATDFRKVTHITKGEIVEQLLLIRHEVVLSVRVVQKVKRNVQQRQQEEQNGQ